MRHDSKNQNPLQKIECHPLFQSVNKTTWEHWMTEDTFRCYEPGETIVSSFEQSPLLLLLEGRIEWMLHAHQTRSNLLKTIPHTEWIGIEFIAHSLGFSPTPVIGQPVQIRAKEPCICAYIPTGMLEAFWQIPEARDYLIRVATARLQDLTVWFAEFALEEKWGASESFIRYVSEFMSDSVVEIDHQATVSDAAHQMASHQVNALMVMKDGALGGILTSSDIVRNVGKKSTVTDAPPKAYQVYQWMTPDPVTIRSDARYDEALALFLQHNIKHLPVMEHEHIRGMLTLSDLMRKQDRGVLQTLQKIEQTDHAQLPQISLAIYDVLSGLIRDGVPIRHTTKIITNLYDRLFCHCIELGLQSMISRGFGPPPLSFCWLQMGSAGRAEQLMLTDQDHFIVYADPKSEADRIQAGHYFAELATEVVKLLEQAGYETCPGKMMANYTQWRGSVQEWRRRLKHWAHEATLDDLMNAFNFFSFRYVYGDRQVYDHFLQMLYTFIEPNGLFLFRLATVVKRNPVTGLDRPMKSLLRVRGNLDFKKEILFPLQHSILILALYHDIYEGAPLEKVEKLVKKKVIRTALADEIVFAYDCLLSIRLERHWTAWQNQRPKSAKWKLSQLNTREQNNLHQSIKMIRTLQNQMLSNFGLM